MRIAVNTRFLLNDHLEGVGYFIFETFKRITRDHPEHEFIFLFDRPFDSRFVFADNVKPLVVGPPARHPVLWKWWYDVKVPRVLKKHKADIFVSCDGYCSLTTSIAQCLVVHDLSFLHYPSFIKRSHLIYMKRHMPLFLRKAQSLATVSLFSKNDIIQHYKIEASRINVVYSAVKNIFEPLGEEEKQETRNTYTGGSSFFLCTGAIHPRKNLVNLLKAFSIFKKRQQNDWKLVLAGRLAWKNNEFLDKLKSYKYRDDVILTGYIDEKELVRLTASAYALLYPSVWEGFGVPVLEAMHCQVPAITSTGSSMEEIAGEAALYADPADPASIADQMLRVYKDESLRKALIEKGKLAASQFSWDRTAELLWECIERIKNKE